MVVIFMDGNVGNLQALYLLLSRRDIEIEGIIVDGGICPIDIGVSNVLQLLHVMKRCITVYAGTPSDYVANKDNIEICVQQNIYELYGDYPVQSHRSLMSTYQGDVISLGGFSTVAEWIENNSITSLSTLAGSTDPSKIGYHIYAIDPDAYTYVLKNTVPTKFWEVDMISQGLSDAVRGIVLSNDILQLLSAEIMPYISQGQWKFWDMVIVMDYLGYLQNV